MKSVQATSSVDLPREAAQVSGLAPKKRIVAVGARHCPAPSAGWFPSPEKCQLEILDDLAVCYQKLKDQPPPDLLVITVGGQIVPIIDFVTKLRMDHYLADVIILMLADESQLIAMMPSCAGMKNLDFAAPASSPEMLQCRIEHLLSLSHVENKTAPSPVHLQVVDNVLSRLINGRRRSEMESRFFKQVLDEALDAAVMFDPDSLECVYANKCALKMWGVTDGRWPVARLFDLWPADDLSIIKGQLQQLVADPDSVIRAQLTQKRIDGKEFPVELRLRLVTDGENAGRLVVKITDISDQVDHNSEIKYRTLHDQLTGLPNRMLFADRVSQTISIAKRAGRSFGLIVMDLDGFKDINDSLGHDAGDDLLKLVANTLISMLRETDTVARLGGDEFAILFSELESYEAIEQLVQKIVAGVMSPLEIESHRIDIGVSIGIARYPMDGTQQERLLRHAEIAMYVAKRTDKSYMAYQSGLNKNKLEMLLLKSDLREAISAGHLSLYYQPQINMGDKRCIGVEALARWIHPERGFVPPDEFIQVAEKAGLIRDLSRWVINEAISQAARWRTEGWPICVAINLSAKNLQEPDLLEFVTDKLNAHGVPPNSIQFELTESDIMSDPETAIAMIESLNRIGVEFSVDDFGTGYSSLAYLKQLNISELKIDRSFISQLTSEADDMVIVHSTITMAHQLGIKVVAEGVEHQEVWDLLEVLECDFVQGYFISRPLPVDELALLKEAGITSHIG